MSLGKGKTHSMFLLVARRNPQMHVSNEKYCLTWMYNCVAEYLILMLIVGIVTKY